MKLMELFNPKYVHFIWSAELEGKEGFICDSIEILKAVVYENNNSPVYKGRLIFSGNKHLPFSNVVNKDNHFRFAYYDPLYDLKVAYEEGKHVQIWNNLCNKWLDINPQTLYLEHADTGKYRILEEPTSIYMTYRQLAEWLAKGNGQCRYKDMILSSDAYQIKDDNKEIYECYKIRRWGSNEWIEPTVDVYKEDCK